MNYKALQSLFGLETKVAVVVGGAGGIGRAIAKGLAEAGAQIAIVDANITAAEDAAQSIRMHGVRAAAFEVDIRNKTLVSDCVERIVEDFDQIDILVNSAGVNFRENVLDINEEHWDAILEINLKGVFLFSQAVARKMVGSGGGRIINIASISSILGHPQRGAYASSKGGVVQFTKVMAIEMAKHNILVNAISPAAIYSPLIAGRIDTPEKEAALINEFPLGRIGQPDDLIGPALFLASAASEFVTGINLVVDGGRTID